jgi:hypothetical protein
MDFQEKLKNFFKKKKYFFSLRIEQLVETLEKWKLSAMNKDN